MAIRIAFLIGPEIKSSSTAVTSGGDYCLPAIALTLLSCGLEVASYSDRPTCWLMDVFRNA